MKTALQKFGKFLSAMVMPNIGAFIAWGFITALFIADGWLPNEQLMEGHMPAGFEMLINNFSVGILGMILAILGYYFIGPLMTGILSVLSAGVGILLEYGLLPLVSIFVEPAKVLFLNNALNHGIFTPIGVKMP